MPPKTASSCASLSDDRRNRRERNGDRVLQRGEEHVGNGVRSGHERAQDTDERRHRDIRLTERPRQRFRHHVHHRLRRQRGVKAGIAVKIGHRHAEGDRHYGALRLTAGVGKDLTDLRSGHPVQEERQRADECERHDPRTPPPVPFPVHALATENPVDADGEGGRRQKRLEAEPVEPRRRQEQRDERVRKLGEDLTHLAFDICLDRHGRKPRLLPDLAAFEVPGGLRTKPALPREQDRQRERGNRTHDRREFRTQRAGKSDIEDIKHHRWALIANTAATTNTINNITGIIAVKY